MRDIICCQQLQPHDPWPLYHCHFTFWTICQFVTPDNPHPHPAHKGLWTRTWAENSPLSARSVNQKGGLLQRGRIFFLWRPRKSCHQNLNNVQTLPARWQDTCCSHCKNFLCKFSFNYKYVFFHKNHFTIFLGETLFKLHCCFSFPQCLGGVQDSDHSIYEMIQKKRRKNKQKKNSVIVFVFLFCLGSSQLFRLKYNLHWGKD